MSKVHPVPPAFAAAEQVKPDHYARLYEESIDDPEQFWANAAKRLEWIKPPTQIRDVSFDAKDLHIRWYADGVLNPTLSCLDRHLEKRGDKTALLFEGDDPKVSHAITYRELHTDVCRFANALRNLGVGKGDRIAIYMPMIPEACVAMLACARIGAIHSVVFGGFAAHNLALRIDDAEPKLLICADAGMRGGKVIAYKPLVDAALAEAKAPPPHVLIVSRGLDPDLRRVEGRDVDYARLRAEHMNDEVPVEWLESNEPSYLLYTSGTTGKPKGIQRDVGGYAVAMALSIRTVFDVAPGQVMFSTSDVGWAVGHSYNVYGPLIGGATALLYEGLPTRPDPGIWWRLCEKYRVRTMFSSPTGIRVLKKQDASWLKNADLSSLKWLFLAGEPLDEPTAHWITDGLGVPVIDNYWQTETGWPAITLMPGLELKPVKWGSPGLPAPGYKMKVINEATGEEAAAGEKGVLVFVPPLPPGCLTTVWRDDDRYVNSYFSHFKELLYSSLDGAIRDADGYPNLLGRTDDVINVAGHRLGTREIEESVATHASVAEAAVIGMKDELKGQVPVVFATLKQGVLELPADVARAMQQCVT
ncbi:MAG: propionate--CoA ligase, partial [Xanthomonadaceae bacterium]|nr:propionate--CoA ligase [Xanthomonadaceae bacterium]